MSTTPRSRLAASAAAVLLVLAAACASQPSGANDTGDVPSGAASPGGELAERAAIDQMKVDAKAIARTAGCATAAQCAAVGIGERPCGGPSEYIVYCPLTTDTAALRRKVADVARAERAYNQKHGLASTCEFRMPPGLESNGGTCRAVPTNTLP